MSFRIERQAAQRARRPAGVHHVERTFGEGPGLRSGQPDTQHRRPVLLVLEQPLLGLREVLLGLRVQLHQRLCLDDHALFLAVPGQRHRADPELLLDGSVQRRGVRDVGGCHGRNGRIAPGAAYDLVQQFVDPLGERGHLGLLQGHAGDAP